MNKLIELVMVVLVLAITALLVIAGFTDRIEVFDDSGDQLVNDTGCKYAEEQKDKGIIDELPEKCKTEFKPEPPEISAT